ncbi:type II toxin-antitoxin system RelE family toxin [Microvirga pudoricolor]|uniref:type II toxin-antitoxin system RelE family toxin n=1 Tax=Microvirga pudoricolor TaxID=2778729 RepID=UPI00194E6721|nr:type II toxin-antitoxin system RelE/ParE family toxin [Microvirga pudoricolor]MBM6595979.1 type II toxin-antitoxin system RelE/ParE family toxin [Microvirga pudoricolor]
MNKTLVYTKAAARSFWNFPESVQEQLLEALRIYALTGEGDVKQMKGGLGLRMRIGDYRVVFDETTETISILAAGHRRDVYR